MSAGGTQHELIGRADELVLLSDLIARHDGEIALVAGEPGIGKSRLISEAIARSGASPTIGTSSPASLGRPFDLILSAVEPTVRWWTDPPASLSAVSGALGFLLRSVAPGLAVDDSSPLPAPGELIGAGIALLRHLDPDLLVLEDLHWADIESLQVVERLIASPDQPMLVATYRPEELDAGHPAGELIRMIESRHAPLHLHLEPFGLDEIREYVVAAVNDDPDDRTLELLRRRTGGNPFFLEQLLAGGTSDALDLRQAELPWTLSETIRRQLDVLDPAERELLTVAAVLGSPFDFDLLTSASGVDERDVIHQLRAIVERGVLVEEEVDLFRFRHELVREAILDTLLGRELRVLHDRAFDALEVIRPDDYAQLARHARGAGRIADLVALAPRGVQHYLAVGATFQALRLAEAALAELPDHPKLSELAARAAWLMGRLETARHHATRWLALVERDQPELEPDALALLARIAFEAGDTERQHEIIDDLECRVDGRPDDQATASLLAVLAQHRMLNGESQAAIDYADRAIAIAERLGLDDIKRRALVERGSAQMDLDGIGDAAEARYALEAIARESEAVGDDLAAARAWHNLMTVQSTDDAEQSLQRMREAAVRCGFDSMAVHYYAVKKVELARVRGDLVTARQWAGRSRLLGRNSGTGFKLARVEAMLALETDDVDDARAILDDLAALDAPMSRTGVEANWLMAIDMVIAARTGDPTTAASILASLPRGREFPVIIAWALRDLAAAGVPTSQIVEAVDNVDPSSDPFARAACIALVDALATTNGDTNRDTNQRVEERLVAAIALRSDPAHPRSRPNAVIIEAELHLAIANLAIDDGRFDEARERAATAARLLDGWPGARRAEALAIGSRCRDVDGVASSLTGRELEVARLLARGLTNGQIADELYIARKTVSTHVSNILAKLHMRSRTEIATWAIDTGVAEPAGEAVTT